MGGKMIQIPDGSQNFVIENCTIVDEPVIGEPVKVQVSRNAIDNDIVIDLVAAIVVAISSLGVESQPIRAVLHLSAMSFIAAAMLAARRGRRSA